MSAASRLRRAAVGVDPCRGGRAAIKLLRVSMAMEKSSLVAKCRSPLVAS